MCSIELILLFSSLKISTFINEANKVGEIFAIRLFDKFKYFKFWQNIKAESSILSMMLWDKSILTISFILRQEPLVISWILLYDALRNLILVLSTKSWPSRRDNLNIEASKFSIFEKWIVNSFGMLCNFEFLK